MASLQRLSFGRGTGSKGVLTSVGMLGGELAASSRDLGLGGLPPIAQRRGDLSLGTLIWQPDNPPRWGHAGSRCATASVEACWDLVSLGWSEPERRPPRQPTSVGRRRVPRWSRSDVAAARVARFGSGREVRGRSCVRDAASADGPWRCGDVEAENLGSRLEHHPVREVLFERSRAVSEATQRPDLGRLDAVSACPRFGGGKQRAGCVAFLTDPLRRRRVQQGLGLADGCRPSGSKRKTRQRAMGFRSLTETWSARTSVRGVSRRCGWLRLAVAAASTGFGLCGA